MKLEYLSEGSPDCPLIRLYSFALSEVLHLRQRADELSTGKLREFALHKEPGIEPIHGYELLMKLGKRDKGSSKSLLCILSVFCPIKAGLTSPASLGPSVKPAKRGSNGSSMKVRFHF